MPFADHNAMIDPSTADLTGRMLELFGDLKIGKDHPAIHRAIEFVWNTQEADHCLVRPLGRQLHLRHVAGA